MYPVEFSIGLLLLIFVLSSFLSFEIFDVSWRAIMDGGTPLVGMLLAGAAVVIMALILWEDFLFPVQIKPDNSQILFRNHFTKLKTQVVIYCIIPVIVIYIYLSYEVSIVPFLIWAFVCLIAPAGGKLISGIKNYNDFLSLNNDSISYRNNEITGELPVKQIRRISIIKDEDNVPHKIKVMMMSDTEVIIDLDEMELEAYFQTIEEFIKSHYPALVE
jgi:hypothetical protein